MPMHRRYWTLLAIAAAKGEPLSPVQLQKALFLLGAQMRERVSPFYTFRAYNYGPFDANVYKDAEALGQEGLVLLQLNPAGWTDYAATPKGLAEADRIRQEVDAEAAAYLERVVAWTRSLSFQQLVRAIYARFPEYRQNSVFQY
jgi:uncharacterized phage-associated protein